MDGQMESVNNNQKFYRHKVTNDKALPENRHFVPDEMNKVAESYEKQFAQFLLKEFYKSVPKQEKESTAGNIYESWMIGEQSDAISKNEDGLGIKNLILEEVYPRKYRNQAQYDSYLKSKANQALQAKSAYKQAQMKQDNFEKVEIRKVSPTSSMSTRKGASDE